MKTLLSNIVAVIAVTVTAIFITLGNFTEALIGTTFVMIMTYAILRVIQLNGEEL